MAIVGSQRSKKTKVLSTPVWIVVGLVVTVGALYFTYRDFHSGFESTLLLAERVQYADRSLPGKEKPAEVSLNVRNSWPAVPTSGLVPNERGVAISNLVRKGTSFFSNRQLYRQHLEEFVQVYNHRPEKDNVCGIRFNHAYALWLGIRTLQPKLMIESGVNSGVSTYFARQASSEMIIVSIDPEEKPLCGQPVRWLDDTGKQERYLGPDKFEDFMKIDWNKKLKQHGITSDQVLVYIDDHLPFFPRVANILKYGFRHVILEDNYKLGQGATPGDKWATPKQLFAGGKRAESPQDAKWLMDNLESYTESPPLVAATLAPSSHIKKVQGGFLHATDDPTHYEEPVLRPELYDEDKKLFEDVMSKLGLDEKMEDKFSYTQIMNYCHITYMEFKAFAPTLRKSLTPILN